mmetsp:Transcript_32903/g.69235  ORF Transcript_32903/g.69235 Transcript_32903/m.69235 type:complete len:315 (+) Transcript_32903:217-1161(+)|eukprot:CAMPEP_0172313900 /NCGR_PEP_ID=MMETSP1058-20130122/21236_1 /TAXON_ID=83371 /ORGANISM="Detonula confervacea, Strain CCMP 353" /LENGTH=314 /DNA_ID=CAMNT_0013027635 /DNA_START=171 /DNA_END=1115 /DNA_ORIENTATION=+
MCNPNPVRVTSKNGITSQSNGKFPTGGTSSALQRMTPLILSGYIFNTLCYWTVFFLLPASLTPAAEYCPQNDTTNCTRRDLFAFQVVSFLNLSTLGLLGFYTFFISKRASSALPQTPQGRYFGNRLGIGNKVLLPEADYINAVIVIFQGWDFIGSIFVEEHCTMIMMTHHLLAFVCGFFCLYYEVSPYYAVYVGGVSEFSSIFLAIFQFFQYYPPSSLVASASVLSSIFPAIETVCQGLFVLTFFIFRIVGWAYMTYMILSDGSYVIKHGLLKRYCPGSGWFLWYLMTVAVLLGALQVFWFGEIAKRVLEVLGA